MALALDGTPVHSNVSGTSPITATFTNSLSNSLIVAVIYAEQNFSTSPVTITGVSDNSGQGLVWSKLFSIHDSSANSLNTYNVLEVWWAIAPTAFSSKTVSVTFSGLLDDASLDVFAVSGVDTAKPWSTDANATKTIVYNSSTNPMTLSGITCSESVGWLMGFFGSLDFTSSAFTGGTGFTVINSTGFYGGGAADVTLVERQAFSSALSGASVTANSSGTFGSFFSLIGAAVIRDASDASGGTVQASATFNGSGSFTESDHQLLAGRSTFVGSGVLTETDIPVRAASATFNGNSSLSGAALEVEQAKASFLGQGSLAVTATEVELATATFSGAGLLIANGIPEQFSSSTLSGNSSLVASAVEVEQAKATFSGAGALNAAAIEIELATARLLGNSSLIANATPITSQPTATFNGSGTLIVLATETNQGTATFSGAGAFTASAVEREAASATLTGSGAFTATTTPVLDCATSLFAGAGVFAASASVRVTASSTFDGVGSLTTLATGAEQSRGSFAGAGLLAVDSFVAHPITGVRSLFGGNSRLLILDTIRVVGVPVPAPVQIIGQETPPSVTGHPTSVSVSGDESVVPVHGIPASSSTIAGKTSPPSVVGGSFE